MEERKLNEKESLELIAQMIQNTKNRLETNCGMPFLFWGYTTLFVSLLVWFLVVTTGNYYWQYLWFLLPIIAGTGTYLSTRNQQPGIKTHLDKVINYIWLVFGITGFLISMLAMFFWQLPILFIILLLMGMGTTLTGLVVGYKTVYLRHTGSVKLHRMPFLSRSKPDINLRSCLYFHDGYSGTCIESCCP